MMRILGLVVGVLMALVVAMWIGGAIVADRGMQRIGEETWPAGLGTLASLETRYPLQKTNDGARRMVALSKPLGISFDKTAGEREAVRTALGEYVKREHTRAESTIGEAPAEVLAWLATHETEIDALRDHLLDAEPIAWEVDIAKGFDAPLPSLVGHMHLMRLFTARALVRGRGDDVRAWDDLHAAWRIEQILEPRPELISQLIALAIARSVNAAAWKLPQPADAAWFEEVRAIDHRRLLAGSYQYEMWGMWRHGERTMNGAMAVIGRPYLRWSIVDMAQRQRVAMEKLAAVTTCSFDEVPSLDDIPRWNVIARIAVPGNGSWQRVYRTIAEREATMNAIRIAQGQPIVAQSACSDGAWRFENDQLSFSREIPKSNETETVMPLSLAIPARATRRST